MLVKAMLCVAAAWGALPGAPFFLQGDAAEYAGKWPDAAAAFRTCADLDPSLAPYARIRLAACEAKQGKPEEAMALLRAVAEESGSAPWQRMACAHLARMLHEAARPGEASPLLEQVLAADPHPWWMAPWAWMAAEIGMGDPVRAAKSVAYFRDRAANAPYAATRRDAARKLVASPELEDRRAGILALLRLGMLQEACTAMASSGAGIVTAQGAPLSFQAARALLKQPPALEEMAGLGNANRDNPWFVPWLVYAGRSLSAGSKFAEAGLFCTVLARMFPGAPETGETLWQIARALEAAGNTEGAMEQYRTLRRVCPEHMRADDAQYELGRWLLKSGKMAEATAEFESLGQQYPASPFRAHAHYLCGGIAHAAGDAKAARLHYTKAMSAGLGDYYAHRALDQLCEMGAFPETAQGVVLLDDGATMLRPLPAPHSPPPSPTPAPEDIDNDPRIARLRFFGAHGLEEGEWEALGLCAACAERRDRGAWYHAVACAGFAQTVWNHLWAKPWGMHRDKPMRERLEIEYPLAYWELVQSNAKKTGLTPFLLLAVMRQESTFRAGVSSAAGATGLMQVMPGTAQWLAKVEPRVSAEMAGRLTTPAHSLGLGACYLARMLDKTGANPVYALAAYNAGPGNLAKWRKRFSGKDMDAFIEAIPFAETRHYVKRVLGNLAAYHSLYAQKAPAS